MTAAQAAVMLIIPPGYSKDIARSLKISAEPKFMPKFTWDRESGKKNFKGTARKKFFKSLITTDTEECQ